MERQEPHGHDHGHHHGHAHGIVDPSIATSDKGLWAVKWSFVALAATAALQLVIVFLSGSVALLADLVRSEGRREGECRLSPRRQRPVRRLGQHRAALTAVNGS